MPALCKFIGHINRFVTVKIYSPLRFCFYCVLRFLSVQNYFVWPVVFLRSLKCHPHPVWKTSSLAVYFNPSLTFLFILPWQKSNVHLFVWLLVVCILCWELNSKQCCQWILCMYDSFCVVSCCLCLLYIKKNSNSFLFCSVSAFEASWPWGCLHGDLLGYCSKEVFEMI